MDDKHRDALIRAKEAFPTPRRGKVQGTVNPDIPCTDKCKKATSRTCTCECGGDNHGIRVQFPR